MSNTDLRGPRGRIESWGGYEDAPNDRPYGEFLASWTILDIGVIYQLQNKTYQIRKWGQYGDPLDEEAYDTFDAAHLAVLMKYG